MKKKPRNANLVLLPAGNRIDLPPTERALEKLWELTGEFERLLPRSRFFRTAIFGSARVGPEQPIYQETRRLARALARRGIDIVTGGGPGIMEAANCGAIEGNRNGAVRSFGLCINVHPNERSNSFLNREYMHGNFFSRLHQFARLASAFVVMPGGIGSALELFMMLQLLQVGHLKGPPLILVGDMWVGLFEWMKREMIQLEYLEAKEIESISLVATAEEAIPIVLDAHNLFKQKTATTG